jgi:elongation factor P hydroxylase
VLHRLPEEKWEEGVTELLACLNPWLETHWQTTLVAAVDEPYYLPASNRHDYHQIQFAHGYFNSVLHELAHWCIAGSERRKLADFGYWYEPDGRTEDQQKKFEQVEIKPQAIECLFTLACRRYFRVSADNLSGASLNRCQFELDVTKQVEVYRKKGLPRRAADICRLLENQFGE